MAEHSATARNGEVRTNGAVARLDSPHNVVAELNGEADALAALQQPPWSLVLVAHEVDAERVRELFSLEVVGLDSTALAAKLPTGPGSGVLLVGAAPMRAAGALLAAGVAEAFGVHLPLGHDFLSTFLEEQCAAVKFATGAEEVAAETWAAWASRAKRVDVAAVRHPDLCPCPRRMRAWSAVADDPPVAWLVDGLVPRGGLVVLAGEPGAGKTLLALDAALRMAHGMQWLGRSACGASTIYLAGEGSHGLGARLRAWRAAHPQARAADGRYVAIVDGVPDLTTLRAAGELDDLLAAAEREYGRAPEIVVIDTLAMASPGADENDAGAMGAMLRVLADLRQRHRVAVVVLHHVRNPQAGTPSAGMHAVRGSSAVVGAADVVLLAGADGNERAMRCVKARDSETLAPLHYIIRGQDTGKALDNGRPEHGPVVLPALDPTPATPECDAPTLAADVAAVVAAVTTEGRVQGMDTVAQLAGLPRARGRIAVRIATSRGLLTAVGSTRDRWYVAGGGANGHAAPNPAGSIDAAKCAAHVPHTPVAGGGANGAHRTDQTRADAARMARVGANGADDGVPELPGGRRRRAP